MSESKQSTPSHKSTFTQSSLPYHDTKPVGAADFYFAINATFRFIKTKLGDTGLRRYWTQLGTDYMKPVSIYWRAHGLPGIAQYWRDFFDAEPGGDVDVVTKNDHVMLDVKVCPAIKHLREHGREIVPEFCQHCYFVSEAAAQKAGYTMRVHGGNGSCIQKFYPAGTEIEPQNLEDIAEAK